LPITSAETYLRSGIRGSLDQNTQVGKTLWTTVIFGLDSLGMIRGQARSAAR
jgi:hypothetical protein